MLPPPQLSVIVPVYNVELYLEECLKSICDQTLKNIEIICVDDHSTDGSRTILEDFARRDSRIRIVLSEQKGVAFARNTGLDCARTDYIQFIDADDYILPTMCERMYTAMCTYDVDAVVCNLTPFYEEGQEYRDKRRIEEYFNMKTWHGLYSVDATVLEYVFISVCTKLMKKSLLDRYAIRFLRHRICEDQFVTRAYLSVAKKIFCLPDRLYMRRFRNGSIMDNIEKGDIRHLDFFYQIECYFRFLKKNDLFEQYAVYFWKYYVNSVYTVANTLRQEDIPQLRQIVDRFILKYHHTIPNVPELAQSKLLLLNYLGYKNIEALFKEPETS